MTPPLEDWTLLDSQVISDNPWNGLRKDRVRLPDGSEVPDFYISVRPHVAIVFALTPENDVILVRQYKHGARSIVVELPAGGFDAGNPRDHAARELREETGYEAAELRELGVLFDDVTKNTNRVHVFIGTGAQLVGEQMLDDIERRSGVEVLLVPLDDIRGMIVRGEIQGESSVAAALLALVALTDAATST
jgi:8-oxo-dGTP pyrophosphatase MutT (NUDIX family)